MKNHLPLRHVIGLVRGVEDRNLVRAEPSHPGVDDVVVKEIERLALFTGAVLLHQSLDFVLEARHLWVHVFGPEERQGQVLAES